MQSKNEYKLSNQEAQLLNAIGKLAGELLRKNQEYIEHLLCMYGVQKPNSHVTHTFKTFSELFLIQTPEAKAEINRKITSIFEGIEKEPVEIQEKVAEVFKNMLKQKINDVIFQQKESLKILFILSELSKIQSGETLEGTITISSQFFSLTPGYEIEVQRSYSLLDISCSIVNSPEFLKFEEDKKSEFIDEIDIMRNKFLTLINSHEVEKLINKIDNSQSSHVQYIVEKSKNDIEEKSMKK